VSNGRLNAARAVRGDVNVPSSTTQFIEAPHEYTSPAFVTKLADLRHQVSQPGAKAIRVHFDTIQIDEPFDSLYVYDQNHRLVAQVSYADKVDYWSPVIPGDTVFVRFTNARVRLDGNDGPKEWVNYNSEGYHIDRIAYAQ
jgi:hypothetical protein